MISYVPSLGCEIGSFITVDLRIRMEGCPGKVGTYDYLDELRHRI